MTGYCRLPILAIAAILIAGCGATPGSSSFETSLPTAIAAASLDATAAPSPSATATSRPSPVDVPTPEPLPTPNPETCPAAPDPQHVVPVIDGDGYSVYIQMTITSATAIGSPDPLPLPPAPVVGIVPSFLVGGRDTALTLSYAGEPWRTVIPTSVTASISVEGQAPIDLGARLRVKADGAIVADISVPNQRLRGTIDISFAWTDDCFALTATASEGVLVDRPAALQDCADGRTRAFDELFEAFEPPILVGGIEVDLLPWLFTGKVTSLAVVDPLPPYVAFRRDSPTLPVAPGATIGITPQQPDLALSSRDDPVAAYFRRAPLIRWLEDGWIHGNEPEADVVLRTALVEHADGSFSFTAPTEPGRYAAEVTFEYDSACSFGLTGFVVGIDIAP